MAIDSWGRLRRAGLAALWLLPCACDSSGTVAGSVDAGVEAAAPSGDAATARDAGDEPAVVTPDAPRALLRIAHASPDCPALDVCIAPHGTGMFQGPLLAHDAAALVGDAGLPDDAGAIGLTYAQVSAYVPVDPGPYDVRLVAAGAPSCDTPLSTAGGEVTDAGHPADAGARGSADWTDLPAIANDTSTTLLVAGDLLPSGSDAPLGVTMMTDDAVLTTGAVVLRAINAVPSAAAIDLGFGPGAGADAGWLPLFTGVTFGGAGGSPGPGEGTLDANGYLPTAPLSAQTVIARTSGDASAETATASNVAIDPGSIATFFAIGGNTGDAAQPPSLLLCIDNRPVAWILADCSVAQP